MYKVPLKSKEGKQTERRNETERNKDRPTTVRGQKRQTYGQVITDSN